MVLSEFPSFKKNILLHSLSLMEPKPRSMSPVSDHGIYSMPSSPNCKAKTTEPLFDFTSSKSKAFVDFNFDEGYEGEISPTIQDEECDPAANYDRQGYLDSSTSTSQPVDLTTSQNMDKIWNGEFLRFFSHISSTHQWELVPTFDPPNPPSHIKQYYYRDTAKVRFVCMDCGNAWTSMKGQVAFWYHLNHELGTGVVSFKLFGQKCKHCEPKYYEHAVWYPEEVVKVLKNVSLEVQRRCYNLYDSNYVQCNREKRLRPGCPRRPHNPAQCLACQEGICQAGALRRKQKSLRA